MSGIADDIAADFIIEAQEILDRLGEQLVTLEQDPQDSPQLNAVFRGYHTLKGGAGFLGIAVALVGRNHPFGIVLSAFNLRTAVTSLTPLLDTLGEDYIRSARAKGLSQGQTLWRHALRNALIPVLTVFGLQVGTLLAGAVLTETIFSWPGIGKWLIEAIGARDYPVVQNGILLIACLVILVNFVVDILYGLANPRIRHQR